MLIPLQTMGRLQRTSSTFILNHFLPYLKTLWSTQIINDIKTISNSHYHSGKDSGASANWSQGDMCCRDLAIQEDCSYSNGIIYNLNNSSQKVYKHLVSFCLLHVPCLPLSTECLVFIKNGIFFFFIPYYQVATNSSLFSGRNKE